jgi:hypothetical protein
MSWACVMGACVMGMRLTSIHLMGVYFMGLHLMGMRLMGVREVSGTQLRNAISARSNFGLGFFLTQIVVKAGGSQR